MISRLPTTPTALNLPTVAIIPLSAYLKGLVSLPIVLFFIIFARYLPCCMATGAIPGRDLLSLVLKLEASPMTNILLLSFIKQ